MPSIFTHAAVPLVLRALAGPRIFHGRMLGAGLALSIVPDADVAAFALGIPYDAAAGHRGLTHSVAFAAVVSVAAAFLVRGGVPLRVAVLCLFPVALSHGLLDMLTNGGLGVALAWPVLPDRWFLPWQPIEVSPIGAGFFSMRGLRVLGSELLWVWLPAAALVAAAAVAKRRSRPQ